MNNIPPYLEGFPVLLTGSKVICDPPVTDTDEDYLVLVPEERRATIEDLLENDGYLEGGSGHTDSDFWSYKNYETNPVINILLTTKQEYFDKFSRATSLAKALNLIDKEDRITLFEAVVRDVWPGDEKPKEFKQKSMWGSFKPVYTYNPNNNTVSVGIETQVIASTNQSVWQVSWDTPGTQPSPVQLNEVGFQEEPEETEF